MHVQQMIATHPDVAGSTNDVLVQCIEACFDCAQACTSCADACVAEESVSGLRQCIRFDLDCADVCLATGLAASRRTGSNEALLKRLLETCAEACRLCGDECARHASMHDHCRVCADACRKCQDLCARSAQSIKPASQDTAAHH